MIDSTLLLATRCAVISSALVTTPVVIARWWRRGYRGPLLWAAILFAAGQFSSLAHWGLSGVEGPWFPRVNGAGPALETARWLAGGIGLVMVAVLLSRDRYQRRDRDLALLLAPYLLTNLFAQLATALGKGWAG